MNGAIVSDPITMVSSRPRAFNSRWVKVWPRSSSAANCISSMARKATSRSSGMLSTVQIQYCGFLGMIFSSPVIRAATPWPRISTTRS
ncbi:MAG: hypothetical protein E2O92_02065 [Alphaproteobacteria bacterium]|nr:MAG: hypothetical protein E2O92_02065 [Alphaproteobacteria bacterium]